MEPFQAPPRAPAASLTSSDSDVPISTQIYWQLAYHIDSEDSCLRTSRRCASSVPHASEPQYILRSIASARRRLVISRPGAGTHVADRRPDRRGRRPSDRGEMLRRAAHSASRRMRWRRRFAAATERSGPRGVQVLFAECTNADAGYDALGSSTPFPARSTPREPCSTISRSGSTCSTTTWSPRHLPRRRGAESPSMAGSLRGDARGPG